MQPNIERNPIELLASALREALRLREDHSPFTKLSEEELLGVKISDIGLNSIEKLNLMMALEDMMDRTLDETLFAQCATTEDLVEFIRRSLQES